MHATVECIACCTHVAWHHCCDCIGKQHRGQGGQGKTHRSKKEGAGLLGQQGPSFKLARRKGAGEIGGKAPGCGEGGAGKRGGLVDIDHEVDKYSRGTPPTVVQSHLLDQAQVKQLHSHRTCEYAHPNIVGLEVSVYITSGLQAVDPSSHLPTNLHSHLDSLEVRQPARTAIKYQKSVDANVCAPKCKHVLKKDLVAGLGCRQHTLQDGCWSQRPHPDVLRSSAE